MTCRGTRKRLLDYVEGRLSLEAAESVKQHLTGCLACRQMATGLGQARDILRAVRRGRAPEGFTAAVRERIGKLRPGAALERGGLGGLLAGYRRWALAGAGLAVVALAWFGYQWTLRDQAASVGVHPTAPSEMRVAEEENEMDEFVEFCVSQHNQYVSQQALPEAGNLVVAQKTRFPMRHGRMPSGEYKGQMLPRRPRTTTPGEPWPAKGEGRQWWWVGQQR